MKILVLGGSGMLGHKLVQRWQGEFDVWTTIRGNLWDYERFGLFDKHKTFNSIDVTRPEAIEGVVGKIRPDVIFNAVGVIKQLPSSKDVVTTLQLNSILPHQLAGIAARTGSRLINISTDCVFDGARGNYTEDDVPNATDLYGKSKNLGEVVADNCLTIRTSIIGRELSTAHGLVEWLFANRGKTVNGFVNAIFSGFPTIVLADIISDLIRNHPDLHGLYHLSSEPINKFELLNLIKDSYGVDIKIEPFDDFHIDRSLDSTRLRQETGFSPASWPEMIGRMAKDETPYENWRRDFSKTNA